MRYSRGIGRDLIDLIRANEWWEYKLVPVLSAFYATALVLRVAVISLWPDAVALLLAIVAAAIYVSVLNDVTDRAQDAAAGKRNRAAEQSKAIVTAVLCVAIGAGFFFAWHWRDEPLLLILYVAIWLAFTLYSAPPFRFKTRGLAGVLCDAGGAHLFAALLAVFVACRGAHRMVGAMWVVCVAAWAFSYGLRGILWHQLADFENDRKAGVHTFAEQHPHVAAVLGTFVIFPIELGALAVMLWNVRSVWPPVVSLTLYAVYAILSARRWKTKPVIVVPKPRFFIVLQEFYTLLFPLALLIAACLRDRRDLVILAAHVLIFPRRAIHLLRRVAIMR